MKKILTYVVILFISFGCDRNEDELLDQAVIENSFCLVENSEKRHSNNAGRTESFLCEEYLITTVVHNLSDGNGNIAYTTAEIQGAMDMLNTEFSQHNIVFDYQIQILEDSIWYYNNDSRAWSPTFLKDTSFVNPMQYNIFMFPVFGELRPPGATDLPSGEGKAALAIGGLFQGQKAALSPILIHEAGHTFSLEHQSPAGTTYTCGNYMYTPQEFPNQINCLQSFDSQQIDQMQNHIENSQYYQFARDYCEENSCVFSQWDLTNRPGSTVTNGSTVNYKIKEKYN